MYNLLYLFENQILVNLFFHLLLFSPMCGAQQPTVLETYLGFFRAFRNRLNRIDDAEVQSGNNKNTLYKFQPHIANDVPFPCSLENPRSNITPSSVHKLKPGDIDIIGAIGDSLTAGFGITATNILNIFVENRGMAFTTGGQGTWRDYLTLPNILKVYNPKLFGFSLGPSTTVDRKSQFNVAETGAISNNIPYMTQVLIKRILRDPRVDLKNHWKMISIFIGSNDFCTEMCYYRNPEDTLELHRKDLVTTLRILRDNLPRTFVNVVLPPDVSVLAKFTQPTETCYALQRLFCPCFIGERFKKLHNYLRTVLNKFREVEMEVANYKEFDREDFAVVVQPVLFQTVLPTTGDGNTDKSFFSVDCFHFSQKTNALVARGYWNNILEPVGRKSETFYVNVMKCPTKTRPYLATRRNSDN